MATTKAPKSPSISLGEAIDRVKMIYSHEGKSNFDDLTAVSHMGYKGLSGTSRTTLASCKSYGLIEGRSPDLSLSNSAITIIADESVDDQTDRSRELVSALTVNKVFAALYDRYKGESSVMNITSFLQKNYNFNAVSAKKTAQAYKDSVTLALADYVGYDEEEGNEDVRQDNIKVSVGDVIQWTSQGVDMFIEPKEVVSIDGTGEWLFVDGEKAGIPMNEASVVENTTSNIETLKIPPQNPNFGGVNFEPYSPSIEEKIFMASALSKSEDNPVSFKLLVTGDMGVNEIGKLIKLLEAQKMILED